jgi:hypothetical protein
MDLPQAKPIGGYRKLSEPKLFFPPIGGQTGTLDPNGATTFILILSKVSLIASSPCIEKASLTC